MEDQEVPLEVALEVVLEVEAAGEEVEEDIEVQVDLFLVGFHLIQQIIRLMDLKMVIVNQDQEGF